MCKGQAYEEYKPPKYALLCQLDEGAYPLAYYYDSKAVALVAFDSFKRHGRFLVVDREGKEVLVVEPFSVVFAEATGYLERP